MESFCFVSVPDDDIEDHPLSKNCLQCFCKVMGGDPRNLPVAMMEGCFDNTCGVFRITIGYWEAANYRTKLTSNKTGRAVDASGTVAMRERAGTAQVRFPARASQPHRLQPQEALHLPPQIRV
ncbi:hypothetical protein evm_003521 [Chilo suppressalis]|nr:hypothetical protein evm_003521 [Chilo suppressalis]